MLGHLHHEITHIQIKLYLETAGARPVVVAVAATGETESEWDLVVYSVPHNGDNF